MIGEFPCADCGPQVHQLARDLVARGHEIQALDKEIDRLRAALKAIADGDGADEQSFDWPEFYASVKKQARSALALDWTEEAKTPAEIRDSMLIAPKWKRVVEAAKRVNDEGPTPSALYQMKHALRALESNSKDK